MNILTKNFRLTVFRVMISVTTTLISVTAYGGDYYVKVKSSGTGAGNNWANAMDNRAFARKLLTAVSGDVFHLASGEYVPFFDMWGNDPWNGRQKTFLIRSGVSIRGGYDADGKRIADIDRAMPEVRLTGVRNGTPAGSNVYHVVTVDNKADNGPEPMLNILTVTGGYANGWGDNSRGAGIFVGTGAGAKQPVRFSRIRVTGNRSDSDGCGIYISSGADVIIARSEITDNTRINTSDVKGGGISVLRAKLAVRHSVITGNAANHGGGIYVHGGDLTSLNCVYGNNTAGTHGGAADIYGNAIARFIEDTVRGNSAPEGGGLHNEARSDIRLRRSVVRGNTSNEGAGFYNAGDCRAVIDSCLIEKNSAMQRGGGIDNRGHMTVTVTRITGNTASAGDGNGGGISQRGVFTLRQSEISYNTARNGGGIYIENSTSTIANATISNNTATVEGGGIYHRFDKCETGYITVTGNTAPKGTGAGIFGNSYPSISNSIVSGNSNGDDFKGNNLYEAGAGSSIRNIIGSVYYASGNRSGTDVEFNPSEHLDAPAFNRGGFTLTHALKWNTSPTDNPAIGKAGFDAKNGFDQTGFLRNRRYPSLGAYEEPFFQASDDVAYADASSVEINVLANDSYSETCTPEVTVSPTAAGLAKSIVYSKSSIVYTPKDGVTGIDTLLYKIECPGGLKDSAKIIVYVGIHYDHPQNIKEEVRCMEDMPAVKFNVRRKIFNNKVRVDGFSIPLVGDLNGDGKPEIIGLGAVSDGGGTLSGLDAVGQSIVIYDGQTGDIILNFMLTDIAKNKYDDTKGYGTRFGFQLRWEPRHNSYSHLAIADLYNDGIGEIVVAETGSGQVYALKPQLDSKGKIINLQKIWDTDILHKHPYTVGDFKDDDVHRFGSPVPYISDLNGDGIPDIIVYNKIYNGQTGDLELALEELNLFSDPRSDKNAYDACKNKAYVGRLTDAEQNDDCMPAVAINDIDGDGIMEIIAGSKIYKPLIVSPDTPSQNSFTVMHGPESVDVNGTKYYLTDGFTVVADIDGDDVQDVIVIKRHLDRKHFIIYVWDSRVSGNNGLKAFLAVQHDADQGHFSIPFVGDINGRADGKDGAKLPEICMTIARLANNGSYPVQNHPAANIPDYTSGANTGNDGTGMAFQGHVVAFTYDTDEKEPSKRLKLSWILKHSDISHQTGIVMFDFDADGINELVYRDEFALRVLSPANRVNGFDFVNLAVTPKTNPDVVRFNERNISSYTGFECPVIADVNGDGSADIVTFGLESMSRIENSAGNLFVYEALGESWAPARPVWNQGIYYPLQINDDLKVPRRPQSTLTKYPSKLPAQKDTVILQPFNGNWIQQPVVRKSNYVPILMTSDPSIQMEQVKIVSSSAKQTVIRVTIDNRGKASANSQTPVSFYHTAIGSVNRILTTTFRRDIFPEGRDAFEYILTGDFRDKIIYVRLVDNGTDVFPISSPIDCDPTNNTVSTMQVTAADDYYSLTRDGEVLLDVCANDTFSRKTDMHIEIVHSARHGQSIVSGTKISYTVDAGFEGIDTLRYRIRCSENNMTVKDEADVYILNLRPGAMEYLACPKANVQIDVKPVTNIAYLWYDSETGGKSLNGNKSANSITVTKKDQNEVVWVQPSAKGFAGTFPRFPVNLTVPDNCGKATPSECMTEGTLLFKEDFGGNSTSDANIAANSRFDGVITGYTHAATYAKNTYTVRKASGGKTEWFDNIYDHTYPGDKSRGYMMQFVVTQDRGQFYECRLNELCEGSTLNISAWIAGLSKNNTANNTGLAFVLEDSEGNALAKYYTGKIADSKPSWTNYGFSFTVPEKLSSLVLRIVNNSSNIRQFDAFVIDDIEIYLCTSKISITGDRDQGACVGAKHEFKVAFKDGGGTPAGSRIAYRWEFRHIDSARWRTLSEADTVVPAEVTHTIAIVSKTDEGYYRMRAGKSGDIDSQNCSAATDSARLRVSKAFRFPDIRIQLSPQPKRTVRLTAYLDSISHTEIRWERLNLHTPAISAGTEPTTGSINTADFVTPGTYTYKYTATSQCGSSESKVYIRTLKDRIFNLPDTVMICRDREEDKLLNINQIFALELGGEWKYDASVNHDATVADNIVAIPQSSKYFGALMFDAANAWKTAPASYSKSYKGHDDAKIFKFVYTAPAGSNFPVKKEFVIVVVGDTMIKI